MPASRLDDVRDHLRDLKGRLARGEIDEVTYFRVKEELLSDLTPRQRQALGTAQDGAMGPSVVPTSVPSLAELELAPGTVLFDQWRIVRELGRGGFGVVFEAEEVHLGETQAVKVLDPAMMSRPELLARFRREVWVMRRLEPRHVVRVYDYREDPDQHLALISMEYVAGGTVRELRDLARGQEQPVPVAAVVAILAQTLEALAEAHDQGMMHRDVTPGNVLLAGASPQQLLAEPTRDPGVKLVDFGIAGLVEQAELSQKTRTLGTAPYVAPEALEPGGEVTPAADVYGAGAVAYELLTGKLPLGRFPQPSETRPDVPPELDRLLPELLDLDPAKRPRARRARTRALAQPAVVPAATQRSRPPSPAPPVARGRRRPWWLAAVLAVLALVATFGHFSDWRWLETGSPRVEGGGEPVAAGDDPEPSYGETSGAESGSPPLEAPPDSWQDPTTGMRFRYIPAGDFTMGSPESEPGRDDHETQHKVTLTRAFWIGETEVTQGQWRTVMGTDPSYFPRCGDQCPVERVSWYEAVTFANRLSQLSGLDSCYELSGFGVEERPGRGCEGGLSSCVGYYMYARVEFSGLNCRGYRLPTEAEWEYAARAGGDTALYTGPLTIRGMRNGPELDDIAWYGGNSGVEYEGGDDCSGWFEKQFSSERCGTHPVARKKANDWGLHDMLGNVSEWTWDRFNYYVGASARDPLGKGGGSARIGRGGNWGNHASYCRAAARLWYVPGRRENSIGFRLVRTYP